MVMGIYSVEFVGGREDRKGILRFVQRSIGEAFIEIGVSTAAMYSE
jgi:hypothetical protein